jgi:AcrR family transcriptional regulator
MTSAIASTHPRTKPPGVRREELMDAAEALFVAKGVATTSIDEIVAAAGVSKGGFYHHFASKDALLTALQERFVGDFLADIVDAQAALPQDDWRGRMDAWLTASVKGFFARLAVHDVVFHEFRPSDRREMNDNAVVDQMEGFLAEGHAAGAWDVAAPRLVAIMLFHALHGACDEAVIAPDRIDQAMLIETLRLFFWRALSPSV